jgi:hypothetical protein
MSDIKIHHHFLAGLLNRCSRRCSDVQANPTLYVPAQTLQAKARLLVEGNYDQA